MEVETLPFNQTGGNRGLEDFKSLHDERRNLRFATLIVDDGHRTYLCEMFSKFVAKILVLEKVTKVERPVKFNLLQPHVTKLCIRQRFDGSGTGDPRGDERSRVHTHNVHDSTQIGRAHV